MMIRDMQIWILQFLQQYFDFNIYLKEYFTQKW